MTGYELCRCGHQARSHNPLDGLVAQPQIVGRCYKCRCRGFKPAPKKRTPKRSSLRTKADTRFSLLIRERDKVCQMCGSPGPLECAHFIPRRHFSVRWTPENAAALCKPCHRKFDGWEMDRLGWIIDRLGAPMWNVLCEKARIPWDKDYSRVWAELTGG